MFYVSKTLALALLRRKSDHKLIAAVQARTTRPGCHIRAVASFTPAPEATFTASATGRPSSQVCGADAPPRSDRCNQLRSNTTACKGNGSRSVAGCRRVRPGTRAAIAAGVQPQSGFLHENRRRDQMPTARSSARRLRTRDAPRAKPALDYRVPNTSSAGTPFTLPARNAVKRLSASSIQIASITGSGLSRLCRISSTSSKRCAGSSCSACFRISRVVMSLCPLPTSGQSGSWRNGPETPHPSLLASGAGTRRYTIGSLSPFSFAHSMASG